MIKSYLQLLRPGNMAIASGGVLLGSLCTPEVTSLWWTFLACLFLAFMAGMGNVENDILDIETDRINRPDRPLPSKQLSTQQAYLFLICLFLGLFALSIYLKAFLFFFFLTLTLSLYNRFFKSTPLLGNLLVAILCASAVFFPSLYYQANPELYFSCFFAWIFTFLREVVKDLEDFEGDALNHLNTTAVFLGKKHTQTLILTLSGLCLFSLGLPTWKNWFHPFFQHISLFLLLPLALFMVIQFFREKSSLANYSRRIKWMMLLGMISIITDRLLET